MKRLFPCNGSRRAFTLIEVVVALVLLATLVVSMVTAYAAHYRQALVASRRQQAIQAADQLLAQWYAESESQVPRNSQGILPGPTAYVWRTEVIHQNLIETLPVEVVRLQLFSNSSKAQRGKALKPLAQVDVIQPVPQDRL